MKNKSLIIAVLMMLIMIMVGGTVYAADPILMAETFANAVSNKYLLGASRYTGDFDLTSIKRNTNILTITILDTSTDTIPSTFVASWDVSKANDGSVTAWLVQYTTDTTMYHLYIGGNGGVKASSGYYLFYYYSKATSINGLDKLDTSAVTNMYYMFRYCSSLTSLDLSSFDTSNVTSMFYMFSGCSSLTSLDLSSFNTSAVTTMSYMFSQCSSLTSIDVSSFNTSSVTNMSYMFRYCSSLTSLDLGNFDTSAVTTMSSMFSSCSSLTSLNVSNFNTGAVKDMSYMFRNCSNLTSLDLSNFNTSAVKDMSYMFQSCSSLTSLDVSSFNTSAVKDMRSMFNDCSSLTSLDLSSFDTSAVTDMGFMFAGCYSLTSLDVSSFNTSAVTDMSYMFEACSSLTSLDVSSFDTGAVTDMKYMFSDCRSLTSLDVSSFDTGAVTDMKYMFYNCRSLTSLDVSSFDTGAVTNMYMMFSSCSGLTSLDVGSFNTSAVTNMSYMFQSCSSLTSIDVSNFNTSSVTNMSYMFTSCSSLTSLEVSSFNTSAVTNMSNMFSSCSKLTNIYLGNNFDRINGSSMFSSTSKLTSIISTRTTPMTVTNSSGTVVDNGLKTSNTTAVIYVPNATVEAAYEADSNYASLLSFTAETDSPRVEPILGLYGEKEITIQAGSTYEEAATVAGFKSVTGTNITPTEVKDYGYVLTQTSNNVDLTTEGDYEVTYKLALNGTEVDTITRNVKVAVLDPILMEETYANAVSNKNLLGASRYTGDFDLTSIKRDTNILTITILDTSTDTIPSTYVASWDVSKDNNGTVTAWLVQDTTDTTMYHLYIGGNGGVKASSGCYLFSYYTACTSITGLDKLDTSLVTSMSSMFSSCSSLTSLDLSSFNTSSVTNMGSMFSSCSSLTSLDVSSFNTSSVTDMSSMFSSCSSLTSLDVSSFNTSKVTSMYAMFYSCRSLTSLDLSKFDTSSVTSMGFMFNSCSSLTSLDVSSFNTSKVTGMSYMFYSCSSLTSLDVSNFNTSAVTNMQYIFYYCSSLTSLDVSNFDTSSVTNMLSMFSYCSSLTSLDVSNFDTSSVTDMQYMFGNCSSLTSLDVSKFDTSSVTSMSSMFQSCSKLTNINLGNNFDRINGSYMFRYTSKLTSIISTRTTPMTVTNSSGTVVDNGLKTSNTKAVIYVPNATVEAAYEADSNYASLLSFTAETDSPRVEPILGLYGEKEITIQAGSTYEEAATVAGFKSTTEEDITPVEVKEYGYVLTQTSNNVDLSNAGKYTVTYKLTQNGVDVETITRTVYVFNPIAEPADQTVIEGTTVEFNADIEMPSDITKTYEWHQIKDGVDINLTEENGVIYKSNIEGQANATATETIVISASEAGVLSFDYMVSSEANDKFTITIQDANGTKTAVDGISGAIAWQNYSTSVTPTSDGKVTLTLTYSKDAKFNGGIDCGAIKNLEYKIIDGVLATSTFETDSYFIVESKDTTNTSSTHAWVLENGIYRSDSKEQNSSTATSRIEISMPGEGEVSFDYMVSSESKYDKLYITIEDANGTTNVTSTSGISGVVDWTTYTNTFTPNANGKVILKLKYTKDSSVNKNDDIGAIRNLKLDASVVVEKYTCTYTSDSNYQMSGSNWKTAKQFEGANTSKLTIPGEILSSTEYDDTKYYCVINSYTTREATLNVKEKTLPVLMEETSQNASTNKYLLGASRYTGEFELTSVTREKIKTITILDTSTDTIPSTYVAMWDASKDNNESVTAWLVQDTEDTTIYHLYIGGECGVIASNGSYLFAYYTACTSIIGLNKLDTSNATSMSFMFYSCSSLTSLDVSGFNTSAATAMVNMFDGCSGLTSLDVTKFNTINVTSMHSMFNRCSGLTSLDVSKFDTSKVTNMSYMFKSCSSLTSLDVSGFNTSAVTNMSDMFSSCSSLTSLDVSNFNTSAVTNMSYMFSSSSSLTNLDVSNFNTSSVTNMSYMFSSCNSLTNLDVSGFNTSSVTNMSYMFYYCSSLTSLDVSNFNTSAVTSMGSMFRDCRGLISLDLSSFNTSSATTMTTMFNSCSSLTNIYLGSNFDRINGSSMFSSTSKLTSIISTRTTPMTVTNSSGTVVDNGLKTSNKKAIIYVPNATVESAYEKDTNYASLLSFTAGEDSPRIEPILGLYGDKDVEIKKGETYEEAATVAGFKSTTDTDITPTEVKEYGYVLTQTSNNVNLTNPGDYKVAYKLTLNGTTVDTITRNVKIIETTPILIAETQENALTTKCLLGASRYTGEFDLTSVKREKILTITILDTSKDAIPTGVVASWDVSKDNNGSVTAWLVQDTTDTTMYHLYIGGECGVIASNGSYLFAYYTACTSISGLDKLDTSDVITMQSMFSNCSSLTSLDVSNLNTSNATKIREMFSGCSSLTTLDLKNFNTSKVTGDGMYYLFHDCSSLTTLDLSSFDTSNITGAFRMFYDCSSLTNVNLSSFDTSNCTNMEGLFYNCSSLKSLDLSNFNTSKVTRMFQMFAGCRSLTYLDLRSFDTSKVTDMRQMFMKSTIEYLLLGNNFDRINGNSMFLETGKLKSIISTRTTPMTVTNSSGTVVDNGLKTSNTTAVIYVPNATVEAAYEKDANYASLLSFTAETDSPRIEPILGLYGDKDIVLTVGDTYKEAATVAGFESTTETDITPAEVKEYGYVLTQTSNNVDLSKAGNYTVTYKLTLNGTEVDTITRNVKVEAIDLAGATITLTPSEYTYDSTAKKPTVKVEINGATLSATTDYDVIYSNNVNAGDGLVTIKAKTTSNVYVGTATKTFKINKYNLSNATIANVAAQTYTGSAIKPTPAVTVPIPSGSSTVVTTTDFEYSYANNTNVGTAIITVKAKDSSVNYTGSASTTFKISQATVTIPSSPDAKTYNGASQNSGITTPTKASVVTASSTTSATNAGTYKVVYALTDPANYKWSDGTVTNKEVTWVINKYNLSNATIASVAAQTYTGSAIKPTPAVTVPIPSGSSTTVTTTDFEYSYANNTNVGTATITVKAKDSSTNYTGSKSINFTINKANPTVNLSASEGKVTYNSTNSFDITASVAGTISVTSGTPANVSITAGNGASVVANTASTVTYKGLKATTSATTITVVFTPTNKNYESVTKTFKVTAVDKITLTKPTLTGTYTYSGVSQTATLANFDLNTMKVENNTRIDAGTQNITVSLQDTANYQWADKTTTPFTISWTIAKKSVAVVWGTTTFEFNGIDQVPTAANINGVNGEVIELTVSGAKTDVGENYTATAAINKVDNGQAKKENYTLTNTTVKFNIVPDPDIKFNVTLDQDLFVWNGGEHKPTPTVTVTLRGTDNRTLVEGTDYTVSYDNNIEPGSEAKVIITGIKNYGASSATVNFTIDKAIRGASVVIPDYRYGTTLPTPTLSFDDEVTNVKYYYNTEALNSNGVEWSTLTSAKDLNAGTYYIYAEVGETAHYKAETTLVTKFEVLKTIVTYPVVENKIYNGKPQSGVQETLGIVLTGDVEATDVGTYVVYAELENDNFGWPEEVPTKKYTWRITPRNIFDTTINVEDTVFEFDGTAKEIDVTITLDTLTLEEGKDYLISYEGNIEVGTGKAIITGIGNFTGVHEIAITISVTPITKLEIDKAQYEYVGSAIKPIEKVYGSEGNLLMKDRDYTVYYVNNVEIGTAIIGVIGKGNYGGNIETTFEIVGDLLEDAVVNLKGLPVIYDGTPKCPEAEVVLKGTPLVYGRDFEVSYENNVNAGENTAVVIITGKGNYVGTIRQTFSIAKANRNGKILPGKAMVVGSIGNLEYSFEGDTPSLTITVSDQTIASMTNRTYTSKDAIELTGLKAGKTSLTMVIAESNNYNELTMTAGITVYENLDKTKPVYGMVVINDDAEYTVTPKTILTLNVDFGEYMFISESKTTPDINDPEWHEYSKKIPYVFGDEEGTKNIYVWFKDDKGNMSEMVTDSIILDYDADIPAHDNVLLDKTEIDKTAPKVTTNKYNSTTVDVEVIFNQKDTLVNGVRSGVDHSTIRYGYRAADDTTADYTWQTSSIIKGLTYNKLYEFVTEAYDRAGNGPTISDVADIRTERKYETVITLGTTNVEYNKRAQEIAKAKFKLVAGVDITGDVIYTYYVDSACTVQTSVARDGSKVAGGAPSNPGVYYVIANLVNDEAYFDATSNVGELRIGWNISKSDDDEVFAYIERKDPNKDEFILNIFGEGKMKDLDELLIGESDESLVYWSEYKDEIVEIDIKNEGNDAIINIGSEMFSDLTNVKEIIIPDSIIEIGDHAFDGCTGVTEEIKIPASVEKIGDGAFADVSTPAFVVDDKNQFYDDIDGVLVDESQKELIQYPAGKADKDYTIPDTIETIKVSAFEGANNLERVVIPNGVERIEGNAFKDCTKLKVVEVQDLMDDKDNVLDLTVVGSGAFDNIAEGSIIYTFSEEVAKKFTETSTFDKNRTKVYWPPVITVQPVDMNGAKGLAVKFIVETKPGNPAETMYQWFKVKDGVETKIEGANKNTYTTGALSADNNNDNYYCRVYNDQYYYDRGFVNSEKAKVVMLSSANYSIERGSYNTYVFETLESAFEFAENDDVIKVINTPSAEANAVLTGNKSVTIDLNDYDINMEGTISIDAGSKLTLENYGNINKDGDYVFENKGELILDGDVSIVNNTGSGIKTLEGSKLEVISGNITADNNAIYAEKAEVKISGEKANVTVSTSKQNANAISLLGNTKFEMTDGNVSIIQAANIADGRIYGIYVEGEAGAKTTISGGTVIAESSTSNADAIVNGGSSDIIITGDAEITGSRSGIATISSNRYGDIFVEGGTVSGKVYAILNDAEAAKITIGQKGNGVSVATPVIVGEKVAIFNTKENNTLEFYDGAIYSHGTNVIYESIDNTDLEISASNTDSIYTEDGRNDIMTEAKYSIVVEENVSFNSSTYKKAILKENKAPTLTEMTNQTVEEGEKATFEIIATGGLPDVYEYEWQVSTDGGFTWTKVTVGNGYNTNRYTTPVATMTMDGYLYRCVITNGSSQITSNVVTLTVIAKSDVGNQRPVARIVFTDGKVIAYDSNGDKLVNMQLIIKSFDKLASIKVNGETILVGKYKEVNGNKVYEANDYNFSNTSLMEITKAPNSPIEIEKSVQGKEQIVEYTYTYNMQVYANDIITVEAVDVQGRDTKVTQTVDIFSDLKVEYTVAGLTQTNNKLRITFYANKPVKPTKSIANSYMNSTYLDLVALDNNDYSYRYLLTLEESMPETEFWFEDEYNNQAFVKVEEQSRVKYKDIKFTDSILSIEDLNVIEAYEVAQNLESVIEINNNEDAQSRYGLNSIQSDMFMSRARDLGALEILNTSSKAKSYDGLLTSDIKSIVTSEDSEYDSVEESGNLYAAAASKSTKENEFSSNNRKYVDIITKQLSLYKGMNLDGFTINDDAPFMYIEIAGPTNITSSETAKASFRATLIAK